MRYRPAELSMCIFQSSVVLGTSCAEAWQRTPGRERRSAHFQDAQVSANWKHIFLDDGDAASVYVSGTGVNVNN